MRGRRWVGSCPLAFGDVEWGMAVPAEEPTMDFPIADLMDEDACYAKLLAWLHPDGLACPRCGSPRGRGWRR